MKNMKAAWDGIIGAVAGGAMNSHCRRRNAYTGISPLLPLFARDAHSVIMFAYAGSSPNNGAWLQRRRSDNYAAS